MLADMRVSAVIPVSDMARAKRFYADTLGLKMGREMGEDGTEFECGGETSLFLYQTPHAGKADHTLAGWNVEDLDAEMDELRGRGVRFEEYDEPGLETEDGIASSEGGFRSCWFKDSEGNILSMAEMEPG